MALFTSDRERRLWLWCLVVLVAIFSTLWLAGTIAQWLDRWVIDNSFFACWLLLMIAIVASGLKSKPGHVEMWVILGTTAVYGMLFFRMVITPAERTHLFEYGLVGVFVYHALKERKKNDGRVPLPALMAILITALLGTIDESIQALIPNRIFDPIDIAFNAIAGLMSVLASMAIGWAQQKRSKSISRLNESKPNSKR